MRLIPLKISLLLLAMSLTGTALNIVGYVLYGAWWCSAGIGFGACATLVMLGALFLKKPRV